LTYTGFTNNISKKIEEHEMGLNNSCFTYRRRLVKLLFHQEFNNANQVIYLEKKMKKVECKKEYSFG